MARPAKEVTPAEDFPPAFWLSRGLASSPSSRDKILALAIDDLAHLGPSSFNATTICDRLGVTYPMVNHYFGSRDGLVAEAVATAYKRYVTHLADTAKAVVTSPRDRLEAWIRAQIAWSRANPGIAVVLNYPVASLEVSKQLEYDFGPEMRMFFEYNMGVLITLVKSVREGKLIPITFDVVAVPKDELISDIKILAAASSVGLATMGASVWSSATHLPSSRMDAILQREAVVMDDFVRRLLDLAEAS